MLPVFHVYTSRTLRFAVIEGLTLSSVADAKKRVEIIVWTNRDNERPTHFISIPLTQPHIKERMAEFRTVVMDSCRQVDK